ncbi:MAG: phage tail protein [Candidatus Aminicenantes bacterium]|nr:phage tail protein [Candidatus Aminicenantes bacterium]
MSILDQFTNENSDGNRINGIASGIVSNNKDPDGLGRVKLFFPWLSDDNETDWARVVTQMGGSGMGSFFLPEVDDEVLVAFEHGDINCPYVIGSLWNGKQKPPETNSDGKNNIRKITSRSGHEIVFNDDDSGKQEKIEIHTNAGHKIVLDDTAGKEKIEITDKTSNNKMVIDSVKNSINIESAGQLKIKAKKIDIESSGSMTLKSNAILTIKGTMVKIN